MTAGMAPILGPVPGGRIMHNVSWPWIAFIKIPIGILTAFTVRGAAGR